MRNIKSGLKGIYALLLCLIIAPAWANTAKPTLFQEIILEAGIENDLRQILGKHYDTFKNNFEMVANPAHLKDGGIFLDGWKTDNPTHRPPPSCTTLGKQAECMRLITTDANYSILVSTGPTSTPPSKYGQSGFYRPPR